MLPSLSDNCQEGARLAYQEWYITHREPSYFILANNCLLAKEVPKSRNRKRKMDEPFSFMTEGTETTAMSEKHLDGLMNEIWLSLLDQTTIDNDRYLLAGILGSMSEVLHLSSAIEFTANDSCSVLELCKRFVSFEHVGDADNIAYVCRLGGF